MTEIMQDSDCRTHDSVNYGKGFERPVYFITGKQQGFVNIKTELPVYLPVQQNLHQHSHSAVTDEKILP
jgi:hypothetical protein